MRPQLVTPVFVLVPPPEVDEEHFVLVLQMGNEMFSVGPYLSESKARLDCVLAMQDARLSGVKPLPQTWRVVSSANLDVVWSHNHQRGRYLMLMMLGEPPRFGLAPEIDPSQHGAVYSRWLPFLERLGCRN